MSSYQAIKNNVNESTNLQELEKVNQNAMPCLSQAKPADKAKMQYLYHSIRSNIYKQVSSDSTKREAQKALYFAKKSSSKETIDAYLFLGNCFVDSDSSLVYYKKALDLAHQIKDSFSIANTYMFQAYAYQQKGDKEKLETTAKWSLEYSKAISDDFLQGRIFELLGHDAHLNGNYSLALNQYYKAIKFYGKLTKVGNKLNVYNKIGELYLDMNMEKESFHWFQKGLKEANKNQELKYIGDFNVSIGEIYMSNASYDTAEKYFLLADSLYEITNSTYDLAILTRNRGKLNAYNKDFKKAFQAFNKALRLDQSIQNKVGIADSYHCIGIVHSMNGNMDSAIYYYKQSIDVLPESNRVLLGNYSALMRAYEKKGDFKQALDYFKRTNTLEEEVEGDRVKEEILSVKKSYEAQITKEKQAQRRIKQKAERQKNKLIILLLVLTILLLLSLVIIFYVNNKSKSQKIKISEITIKNHELEQEKSLQKIKKFQELILDKNTLINRLHIEAELAKGDNQFSENLIKKITNEENWAEFMVEFEILYKDFFEKLNQKYEGLTKTDNRLLALIKLKLTDKEIASLLNVSNDSIRKAKSRLTKKMNLTPEESLLGVLNIF